MATPHRTYTPENPPPSFRFPDGLGIFSAFLAPDQAAGSEVVKWEAVQRILTGWKRPPKPPVPPSGPSGSSGPPPPDAPGAKPPPLFIDPAEVIPADVWKQISAQAVVIGPAQTKGQFAIPGARGEVGPYDLEYCAVETAVPSGAPGVRETIRISDSTLICGFNLQQRIQRAGRFTSSPPTAPLAQTGIKPAPYDSTRVEDWKYFEYWCNSLYVEVADVRALNLIRLMLQGRAPWKGKGKPPNPDVLAPDLQIVYRCLPRTPEEREDRDRERAALVANPVGPYRWLDDAEAQIIMRVMMQESMWIMPRVADDKERARLLPLVGGGYELPAGIHPTSCFAYHATARDPAKLKATGTHRSVSWRGTAIGMDATWSPFHPSNGWKGELLFRRGSADNELHSTVSIAQSPVSALDFPLIQSVLSDNNDYKASVRAADPVPLTGGPHLTGGVPAFTLRPDGMFETETWVYLVTVDDIHDTGELQLLGHGGERFGSASTETWLRDRFIGHGELATTDIPVAGHLFGARYARIHCGATREQGMRYRLQEIVPVNLAQWTGKRPLNWKKGDPLPLAVKLLTEQVVNFPMCGVKRGQNMTAEAYIEALHQAHKEYRDMPATVLDGVAAALTTLFSTGQPDLELILLTVKPAITSAWYEAHATLLATAAKEERALEESKKKK